ncbi:7878_t:CDS:1, partial [Gigaspora rosea]
SEKKIGVSNKNIPVFKKNSEDNTTKNDNKIWNISPKSTSSETKK